MEQVLILNRLLDKYENSKHLTQPGASTRRVMLRIDKKELPEYQREIAAVRDRYNQAARELERDGLVQLEWISGQPVFSHVILELSNVERAYSLAGRQHPRAAAQQVYELIQAVLQNVTTPWIAAWRDDVSQTLQQSWKLPSLCKKEGAFLADFLKMLSCYDGLAGEITTVRAFSIRCFQNSKRFEWEFQEDFLRIAERYHRELDELCSQQDMSSRDKLAFLGIYAHPELYQMSGCCSLLTKTGQIDLSPLFPVGIALPSTAVDSITGFSLEMVNRIVFIENKTNYEEYLLTELAQNELVFYHGGFLSPQKHILLEQLAASLSDEVDVVFWADIDLGGFQMFERLHQIFPQLCPMRMSGQDVERYREFGLARQMAYLQYLQDALNKGQFLLFQGAIEKILHYGVTIEQEVFLS